MAWCGSVPHGIGWVFILCHGVEVFTSWYRVDVYFMAWCVGIYFIVNVICMGWMFILWLGEVACVYFMVRCGGWGIVLGLCVVTFPVELGNFPLSFSPCLTFIC